jgi:hypothetical protein
LLAFVVGMFSVNEVFAGEYAYMATNPSGTEVKEIEGEMYVYANRLATNNKHIDTMAYATDLSDFSVGIGYYDSQNSSGSESYKYLRYWNESAMLHNLHYLGSSISTGSFVQFALWEVDSDSYDFQVGSQTFSELSCQSTCATPTIAGVVSWSTADSASDNVKSHFRDLVHLVDSDVTLKSWDAESQEVKCNDYNTDYDYPTAGDIDEIKFDVAAVDECSSNSSVWLYNGGSGG